MTQIPIVCAQLPHTHAHVHTHARKDWVLPYLLSGSGMKVKVAVATEELCVFAWCVSAPRCKRSLCLAYRRLKDTRALIIFAVSPPRHVAQSANGKRLELFTSAAFNPQCGSFILTERCTCTSAFYIIYWSLSECRTVQSAALRLSCPRIR